MNSFLNLYPLCDLCEENGDDDAGELLGDDAGDDEDLFLSLKTEAGETPDLLLL